MKIYDFPYAPNPRKVRIYLSEKDIDMDFVMVDIRQNEQAFSLLDAMMGENLFVAAGVSPSIADCTLIAALEHGSSVGVHISDKYKQLSLWYEFFRQRPSFKANVG